MLASQIPAGSDIRLTFDAQGVGQTQGYLFGVDDLMFRIVAPSDTNGDGEVNSTDLFAMLGAGKFNAGAYTVASSTSGHDIMTATIDPATGDVTLDASNAAGTVSGWGIFSASGIFNGDAANIDPGVSFVNTDTNSEVSTGLISLTGTNDLGNIIGASHRGQSSGFYDGDITGKFFLDGVQGEFALGIQVIPEPSSLLLAALGLVSLAGYGWRRRRTAA